MKAKCEPKDYVNRYLQFAFQKKVKILNFEMNEMNIKGEDIRMTRQMRGALKQPVNGIVSMPTQGNERDLDGVSNIDKNNRRNHKKPKEYPLRGPHTRATDKFRLNSKSQINPSLKDNNVIDLESCTSESIKSPRKQKVKAETLNSIEAKNGFVTNKGKEKTYLEESSENESGSSKEKEIGVAQFVVGQKIPLMPFHTPMNQWM